MSVKLLEASVEWETTRKDHSNLKKVPNLRLSYFCMCFERSVKIRKRDKATEINQLHFTFYRGIICHSLWVNKLCEHIGEVLFKA